MKYILEKGGDRRAEKAVRKGLTFLGSQQDSNTGKWGKDSPVSTTALCLLAYLGHCETPESPRFGDSLAKAAIYLMDWAITKSENPDTLTENAMTVFALAELHLMTQATGTEIPQLETLLENLARKTIAEQDPDGGWSPGGSNQTKTDTFLVSGWMFQALNALSRAGLDMPEIDMALNQARQDRSAYHQGMEFLRKASASEAPAEDFERRYFTTNALFQQGGEAWNRYQETFLQDLISSQDQDGSWSTTIGGPAGEDFIIRKTAWSILMLEVYYR